jgi:hypothetical protein
MSLVFTDCPRFPNGKLTGTLEEVVGYQNQAEHVNMCKGLFGWPTISAA